LEPRDAIDESHPKLIVHLLSAHNLGWSQQCEVPISYIPAVQKETFARATMRRIASLSSASGLDMLRFSAHHARNVTVKTNGLVHPSQVGC
jgi:hypothetical protein